MKKTTITVPTKTADNMKKACEQWGVATEQLSKNPMNTVVEVTSESNENIFYVGAAYAQLNKKASGR